MVAGKAWRTRTGSRWIMADRGMDDGVDRGSLQAHVKTYDGVIAMLKWGTVASVLIAALVIWLIV